ncbi:MAG: electron transfer flavoprotein subunit alpha/FixB family protein, partial [Planctomycetes bacterium]|nr:electron transfer flavoprotein subunit alpha/FixB family protein [Planctomycetota bacterium]
MSNIVILAEVRDGSLKRTSLEAVTLGLELATATGGKAIALACGSGLDAAGAELAKSGVSQVVAIDDAAFANYSGDAFSAAIAAQAKDLGATGVIMAHTAMGKDLMPRVAAALEAGIATDVVAASFADGAFTVTKPIFAGKVTMTARSKTPVFCITLRSNNYAAASGDGAAAVSKAAAPAGDLLAVVKEIVSSSSDRTPLQEAKVVVAGGRGLKEAEHFKMIEDLAAAFGPGVAAVGASRAVVDAG